MWNTDQNVDPMSQYFDIALNNTWANDIFGLYIGGILRPLQSFVSLLKLVENIFQLRIILNVLNLNNLCILINVNCSIFLHFHRIWMKEFASKIRMKNETKTFYYWAVCDYTETTKVKSSHLFYIYCQLIDRY